MESNGLQRVLRLLLGDAGSFTVYPGAQCCHVAGPSWTSSWEISNMVQLKDFMAELMRKGRAASSPADEPARRPIIKTDPRTSLPYIECAPDAPARRMTAEELIAIEEQTQFQSFGTK